MNLSKIIPIAALTILAAAGAQAEIYDGVHALTTGTRRADVQAEAATTARSANPYAEGASSGVTAAMGKNDRTSVRTEAVAAARAMGTNQEALAVRAAPQQMKDAASSKHRAM